MNKSVNYISFIKQIALIFTLFFYIFPVSFVFMPFSTHVILGIFGFIYWLLICISRKSFLLSKSTMGIVKTVFIILVVASISYFLNSNSEDKFIFYFFPLLVNFSGAFFISRLFILWRVKLDESVLCYNFVLVVMLQMLITLLINTNSNIMSFFLNIQKGETIALDVVEETISFRLIGFGAMFFYAGIINSIALLTIAFLYIIGYVNRFVLVFFHIVIFSIGMIMARTTLIGFTLSLLLLVMYFFFCRERRKIIINFLYKYLLLVLCFIVLLSFFLDFSDIEKYYKFGFEMFDNYLNGEGLSSQSTNQLSDLYVYPTKLTTYIYGDSRWMDPLNSSMYYMHTDVGYLRLIFCFGIMGLIAFSVYYFNLIHLLLKHSSAALFLLYSSFGVLFLILNFKGFADFSNILYLFYFSKKCASRNHSFSYMKLA